MLETFPGVGTGWIFLGAAGVAARVFSKRSPDACSSGRGPGFACLWGWGAWVPVSRNLCGLGGGGGGDSALPPGSAGNEAELVAEPCGGRGKAGPAPGGLPGVLIRRAEAGCVTWAGDAKAGRSPSWEENR